MRTIYDLYLFMLYICKKEQGVFLKVSQFNQNINFGMLDAVETWFAGYGVNQHIHDALRPIRVYQSFTSNTSGLVVFESNYIHLIGTPYTIMGSTPTNPRFVNEDEMPSALTSQLRTVDMENPVLVDAGTGFQIFPQTTHIGMYWYLRRPTQALLAVTQVGRVVTYDPITSVQIELNEMYWNNILAAALKYTSINMDEKGIYEYAAQYQKETE